MRNRSPTGKRVSSFADKFDPCASRLYRGRPRGPGRLKTVIWSGVVSRRAVQLATGPGSMIRTLLSISCLGNNWLQ